MFGVVSSETKSGRWPSHITVTTILCGISGPWTRSNHKPERFEIIGGPANLCLVSDFEQKARLDLEAAERAEHRLPTHGAVAGDPVAVRIAIIVLDVQMRQCLTNVWTILEAAGSSMDKVVSATFVLAEEADFAGMNEEWQAWFPIDPPARQGAALPVDVPGLKVSVAAIAEV